MFTHHHFANVSIIIVPLSILSPRSPVSTTIIEADTSAMSDYNSAADDSREIVAFLNDPSLDSDVAISTPAPSGNLTSSYTIAQRRYRFSRDAPRLRPPSVHIGFNAELPDIITVKVFNSWFRCTQARGAIPLPVMSLATTRFSTRQQSPGLVICT
jgi:hypothetical protein